jgi:hypothetical protein
MQMSTIPIIVEQCTERRELVGYFFFNSSYLFKYMSFLSSFSAPIDSNFLLSGSRFSLSRLTTLYTIYERRKLHWAERSHQFFMQPFSSRTYLSSSSRPSIVTIRYTILHPLQLICRNGVPEEVEVVIVN